MTILHLWGRMSSINVRKVVWALQELGLPFTRSDAGLAFGVTKTPEYLAKNPNALVPLLEDGGFALWESNAIVRYLLAKYGAPTPGTAADSVSIVYPANLQARFDQERWMDWQQTTFNSAGREAFIQLIRTPAQQRSAQAVQKSVAATALVLNVLDAHLAKQPCVSGSAFGMADIPLGCEMHRWWGIPESGFAALGVTRQPITDWQHVARWWSALQQRPAARGVLDQALS